MARSKQHHSINMQLPICQVQLACDGTIMRPGATVCSKCRDKQAKANKPPPPLRGDNTCITKAELKARQARSGADK